MFELAGGGSGGGFFSRRMRKTRKIKNQSKEKTIPALAFVFPYNELLMRGHLEVDGIQVKTRSNNWSYRGQVLLYTSKGHHHKVPARAYHLNPDEFPTGVIVGMATVVDSKELSPQEKVQVTMRFNRVNSRAAEDMLSGKDNGDYVVPLPFGVFLKDVKRFKTPVPFKPKPGAIGIMRVPVRLVAKALKEVGVDSKSL